MNNSNRIVVPIVTPTSSFSELTKFLVFSFQECDRSMVEHILVQREKGLKNEVQNMERLCQMIKRERDVIEQKLRLEMELLRENYEEELKRERDLWENMVVLAVKEKSEAEEALRKEFQVLEVKNGELEKKMRIMEYEVEERENYEEELRGERDLFQKNVCLAEIKHLELVKELRKDFEERIEALEGENREFKNENELGNETLGKREAFEGGNRELQKKIELGIETLGKRIKALEGENRELKRKIELGNETLGKRIEQLEGENRELKKKIELGNESLGKEFAIVEERLAKLKGVFGSVCSGNGEVDRGSGNQSDGRVLSSTDSYHKVFNLESCPTKFHSSPGDPSAYKNPQVESRDSEGTTIGVQLKASNLEISLTESQASPDTPTYKTLPQVESVQMEVKTGSFLEYAAEDGGCSENNINCKRKRSINGTEGDKDSTGVNKKIKSRCKKISLPIDIIGKANPVGHVVSKASPPPKFSLTGIKQCKDKNGRCENSELHFTQSIGDVVDGINRCFSCDPHEASRTDKEVAGFQSGKEIRWKYPADMLSAFGNDPELCMAAVCALYRQTISARVSKKSGGFSSLDIVSGTAAAKYLVNNDPANKLSRSVLEVQQNCPSILRSCQRLANQYGEQLFEIYRKELDPFFCRKS